MRYILILAMLLAVFGCDETGMLLDTADVPGIKIETATVDWTPDTEEGNIIHTHVDWNGASYIRGEFIIFDDKEIANPPEIITE